MIKYDIKNFNGFFTSIINCTPVYAETFHGSYPIPDLKGLIYSFMKDDKINIVTIFVDDNKHIEYNTFKKMLITRDISGDTIAKIFTLEDVLDIYNHCINYNLFVLDDTYDKYIENNN